MFAATSAELQQKIADTQRQRDALLEEQKRLQAELDVLGKQGATLQGAVKSLDATRLKLVNDIKITQSKINSANLNIQSLENSIANKEDQITTHERAIKSAIKELSEYDSHSMIVDLLNNKTFSEIWTDQGSLSDLNDRLNSEINSLQEAQLALTRQKTEKEKTKQSLVGLKTELGGQKSVVEENKTEKARLLALTKSQEAAYQKMLAENIARGKQFEADLINYESQLKFALDPSSIPSPSRSILSWPLDKIFVTQYFGYTPDAARLYRTTAMHNGVDFRANIGTSVKAALGGIVTDIEAVKTKNGCQYGKWILIKHPNGLSTIYGHLSAVLVKPGNTITTGQIIGYSGQTGYSEGPHLHFGLYVTAGIKIVDAGTLKINSSCAGIKTVAAPVQAYLDPLAYMPTL